tara:strand:- start:189 stop:806 length:618 start_codon:yes stop_codon:yes gene_type:complete
MHGSSGTMLIVNLSPMSEEEMENERLREMARGSHLGSSDDILSDHMEMVESQHFSKSRMPDFARAMGASDDEIKQLELQFGVDDFGEFVEPAGLSSFKSDYVDLQHFGGDPVSLEMSRDAGMGQMSGVQMDDMLSVAMVPASIAGFSDAMTRAKADIEERFGHDTHAVLEGEFDGYVLFSVDTPDTGLVKYIYDSRDGAGRVMRG